MNQRRPAIFTFHASEFYDKPLVVWNSSDRRSFVDLGVNRITLEMGEEKSFDVPRGAEYLIGLGSGVRLAETGQELLAVHIRLGPVIR